MEIVTRIWVSQDLYGLASWTVREPEGFHRHTKKGTSVTTRNRSPADATASDEKLLASLRQFIRTKGADYLNDPNISSVGVGYKITEGKATREIPLQFTVDEKVGLEDLHSVDTVAIPETIVVDGVAVPPM